MILGEPELVLRPIELLCARLRRTCEQVEDIIFLALPARLAKTLLWLSDNSRFAVSREVAIIQLEIDQIVGMTSESTKKVLRACTQRSWIRLERGGIVVLDPDARINIEAR